LNRHKTSWLFASLLGKAAGVAGTLDVSRDYDIGASRKGSRDYDILD